MQAWQPPSSWHKAGQACEAESLSGHCPEQSEDIQFHRELIFAPTLSKQRKKDADCARSPAVT